MLIRTENEIISLMPTARWSRPEQLFGYLEEEERVALEPLLGNALYMNLLSEYERLREKYVDITSTTVKPNGKAKSEPFLPHADVTERIERIHSGESCRRHHGMMIGDDYDDVPAVDLAYIRLIRICQQIEFYRMLSHKAGMLTVSFNEGGGMNVVTADGYDPAEEKRIDRVVKDAFMSAGRATDALLLFLEADAKGEKQFTELWKEADAFYLHKDLLFQTARVLNEYLPIKGERMAYVELVRDIRFCQNTYLKPRIGAKLLKAVIAYANDGVAAIISQQTGQEAGDGTTDGDGAGDGDGTTDGDGAGDGDGATDGTTDAETIEELLSLLRTALAFYVETRRVSLEPVKEKMARRDSMTDAQQAMAMACEYIEANLDALGEAATGTPIYNAVRAREAQEERERACACAAAARRRREACERNSRKLFTGFPATHRTPERI